MQIVSKRCQKSSQTTVLPWRKIRIEISLLLLLRERKRIDAPRRVDDCDRNRLYKNVDLSRRVTEHGSRTVSRTVQYVRPRSSPSSPPDSRRPSLNRRDVAARDRAVSQDRLRDTRVGAAARPPGLHPVIVTLAVTGAATPLPLISAPSRSERRQAVLAAVAASVPFVAALVINPANGNGRSPSAHRGRECVFGWLFDGIMGAPRLPWIRPCITCSSPPLRSSGSISSASS